MIAGTLPRVALATPRPAATRAASSAKVMTMSSENVLVAIPATTIPATEITASDTHRGSDTLGWESVLVTVGIALVARVPSGERRPGSTASLLRVSAL